MPIIKVQSVPLIAQKSDGVCWCACALMVYKWAQATGNSTMKNPLDDAGMNKRYENNGDWGSSQNGILATTFNMKKHSSVAMDFEGLNSFLQKHGPIWTAGQKNWGGNNHGHVVVICGVADTGVFIHDPEPVGQGSSQWLTWAQINKYVDGATEADVKFLTAV